METHLQLKVAFETYLAEHDKFEQNGVKAITDVVDYGDLGDE